MDRDSLERIRNLTKDKITVSNFQKEQCMSNKNRRLNMKKMASVACICLILTSGIVFAKDIEKFVRGRFNFGLGDGVDSAAENGYIAEPEMEQIESETKVEAPEVDLGTIVDNINTSVKIESFLMDDYNLSVEFAFEFDDSIKEVVDLNKLDQITLNDLIVLDEEKRIIFASTSMGETKFNEFCQEQNLNFKFGECNENYMNTGLNWFPQNIRKDLNQCTLVYNMYTEGYPKSKELNFYFNEITITEQEYVGEERTERNVTLTGKWNMHVDVPEKMYNRTSESYRVISCENERFNVYAAKVMDTGFEIGIMISDMVRPEYPEELAKKEKELLDKYKGVTDRTEHSKEWSKLLATSPYREMWNDYYTKGHPINVTGFNVLLITDEKVDRVMNSGEIPVTGYDNRAGDTKGCYVINSNGEEFRSTMSPSRKANNSFVKGNQFDFYETFGMTKYDATDRITVVIEFYGEPVKIELEKIK